MYRRPTTVVCEWCHEEFLVPSRKGPVPKFCRPGHRQMAFIARKIERLMGDNQIDPLSALVQAGVQMHEMFTSMVVAGFTEAQALILVAEIITRGQKSAE